MHEDLEKLIHLQRVDNDLRHAETDVAEVPRQKAELEASIAQDRGRLDAAREALAASQKARRQHETELQDLETKRSRYKGQLMEVKTNKEYTAMLHEIEGVEREIRAREDQILVEMEKAETLVDDIKREEVAFKAVEERHRGELRALDEKAAALEREAARLRGERDAAAAALPGAVVELYQRVAKLRGSGVSEARDGICQQCRVKLRPQMYVDVKRNDTLIQCPSCSRVLFYEAPAPVASPEP